SNSRACGLFLGLRPLNTSLTYILATRRGVPLRLSSVRSRPRMCMISRKCFSMRLIFSSSSSSNASGRSGVSAEEETWSSASSSSSGLRGRIFNEISFCLIQGDFQLQFRVYLFPENLPDNHGDVLSSGIDRFEVFSVEVEVPVIEFTQNIFLDQITENLKVVDEARLRVWLANYAYNQLVVMSVVVGVAAFSENPLVFRVGPVGMVKPMGSIEMLFPGNSDLH